MVILGVADGRDAGAALVVGARTVSLRLQEHFDRIPSSDAFPWEAIEQVLADGDVRRDQVDVVAVAGRITPPLIVRRHRGLRSFAQDPFSAVLDAQVARDALLRQSGLAAVEADRAADFFGEGFAARGMTPRRLVMVEQHRALAAAAYRTQGETEAVVVTLHGRGDGIGLAVHRGRSGQLEQILAQAPSAAVHLHLDRCRAVLGLRGQPHGDLSALGARGSIDEHLVAELHQLWGVDRGQIVHQSMRLRGATSAPWRQLASAPREIAAASVVAHLRECAVALALFHAEEQRVSTVVLAGSMLADPRVIAAVADAGLTVHAPPVPGFVALPLGAALSQAGTAPAPVSTASWAPLAHVRVPAGGVPFTPRRMADRLHEGDAVVRFVGGHPGCPWGGGGRSVWVADGNKTAIRARLRLPGWAEPAVVALPRTIEVVHRERLESPLTHGTAAVRVQAPPIATLSDGRMHLREIGMDEVEVTAVLTALAQRGRAPVAAIWPLREELQPIVSSPDRAVDLWRRAHFGAMQVGPHWIERR